MCSCSLRMTLCWFSTRCWLWYEVARCHGLSKGWLAWYLMYGLGLWIIWKDTSRTDWDGDYMGRCPEYGLGLWKVLLESAKDRL
jgi:hypothetical protein